MADSVYLDPSLPIKEGLSELPSGFKSYLRSGFTIIALMSSAGKTAQIVNLVLEEEGPSVSLSRRATKELAAKLGIDVEGVPVLLTTVTFCITIFVQQKTLTTDLFLAAAQETGLVGNAQEMPALRTFIDFVAQNRAKSSEIADQKQIVAKVLPLLTRITTVVDIRPAFTEEADAVEFSVPVVIARIETDTTTDDFWMQMSKKQVQRLIDDLEAVLRRVETAEKWSAGNAPGKM